MCAFPVVMTDPGIHNASGYEPWEEGLKEDIFVKDKNGKIFIGKLWPGFTAYPDFLNPKTFEYWGQQVHNCVL